MGRSTPTDTASRSGGLFWTFSCASHSFIFNLFFVVVFVVSIRSILTDNWMNCRPGLRSQSNCSSRSHSLSFSLLSWRKSCWLCALLFVRNFLGLFAGNGLLIHINWWLLHILLNHLVNLHISVFVKKFLRPC